ncbi:GAF and ANTAR domain-containing protein [Actinoallomurus acaciae]|uniref:GAF and ANTAR domain-containing protein n=1 Tax=Actinoallomurus acaciae TaxID=502577 RepID=A0ABV5Y9D7_9ACTN
MAKTLEPQDWAVALARAAHDLQQQESLRQTLERATSYAVDLVGGCDAAGIIAVDKRGVRALSASDPIACAGDRLQQECGGGPSFEAIDGTVQACRVADLDVAPRRWRRFTEGVVRLGIAGVMALPLLVPGEMLGVLNVYSLRRGELTVESERLGALLASHIAVAFATAQAEENLRTAVTSHQQVGEAVGILMERYRIGKGEALAMLTKASQNQNTKLRELARQLVETGEVPGVS